MLKTCEMELNGIRLVIDVEYEGEGNKVSAYGVETVSAQTLDGSFKTLECDVERFYKDLEGEVQEALENAIQADYEAYCDALYEQAREECKL